MAQTKFVLSKALAKGLNPIVVLNKVDRDASRVEHVDSELFDLFASLGATDSQMEYPMIYASAKQGWAAPAIDAPRNDMKPLFETIVEKVPPPKMALEGKIDDAFSMLVTQIEPNPFFGKCYLGRIASGHVTPNQKIKVLDPESNVKSDGKVLKLFMKQGTSQVDLDVAAAGDIISIAGIDNAYVNSTLADPSVSSALEVCYLLIRLYY